MWRTATSQMPVQTEGTDATVGDRVTMHCKKYLPTKSPNLQNVHTKSDRNEQTSTTTRLATTPKPSSSTTSKSPDSPPRTATPKAGAAPSSAPTPAAAALVLTVSFQFTLSVAKRYKGNTSLTPTAWINTKIILDVADPDYINTLGKGQGVTGDLVTSDNGKTWTVKTISIPAYSF